MDTLTQALINAQKPQDNPWQTAGQGMSNDTMTYLTNDNAFGNESPNSRLVAALISGLGGAALQGFGAYQEKQRRNQLTQDLMKLSAPYYGGEDLTGYADQLQSSDARNILPLLQIEQAGAKRELAMELKKAEAKRETDFQYDLMGKGIEVGMDENGNPTYQKSPIYDLVNKDKSGKTLIEDPTVKTALAQALAKKPLSEEQANALANTGSLDIINAAKGLRQINEVGGRFDTNTEIKRGGRMLPGYARIVPGTITDTEAAKWRERVAQSKAFANVLETVANDPNYDPMQVMGNNAAYQEALKSMASSLAVMGVGSGRNAGANLTPNEQGLVKGIDLALLSTNPMEAIKRYALNRDPRETAKTIASVVRKTTDSELLGLGFARRDAQPGYYSPDMLKEFEQDIVPDYRSTYEKLLTEPIAQEATGGSPVPSPSIPPGMKLQRNPKTGATRLVPM